MKTLEITKIVAGEGKTVVYFSTLNEEGKLMNNGEWIVENEMPELTSLTNALLALGKSKVAPDEVNNFVVKVDFAAPTPDDRAGAGTN